MGGALDVLPNDVEELKRTVSSQQQTLESQQKHISILEEEIRFLKDKLFGRKADRWSAEELRQGRLFNEAEQGAGQQPTETEQQVSSIPVASHTRQPRGRRALPANLPREEVVHDIPEEQKVCACGASLSRIGEETSEKLKIIPPKLIVVRHIRPKYACRSCQGVETEGGAVKIAEPPAQLIPKGIATPELLAYLLTSKFVDALPFYRQEKMLARIGVDLSRATMCNWAIQVAQRLQPLLELLRDQIRAGPYVQIDETTLQVLDEPGREAESKSYMWVYRGGESEKPSLIYQYFPSRSGDVPFEFLDGYEGYVQTDGYAGYDKLGREPGILMLGCWAHVRRKFVDVTKVSAGGSNAHDMLELIRRLYEVEHAAKQGEFAPRQIAELRMQKALPILTKIEGQLQSLKDQTPPQGLLGKATGYALGQWERLTRYVENGILRPDNNLAENAIRPFVVGRKNWLFAATPAGAYASAALFSVVETAKANGHEPYWYLRFLLSRLATASTTEDYRALLPQNVRPDELIRTV
jgi:transposase